MERIRIFDSLRGYCVLWIIFIHLAELLNLSSIYNFGILYEGSIPVTLFFTLSGYVITGLLEYKQESYGTYLFRRYFRLVPAIFLLSLLYLFAGTLILDVLQSLDTQRETINLRVAIFESSQNNWWQHLLLRLTPFYGFFDQFLAYSTKAFIPPGWSVAVEWQFYLLAPLMVLLFKRQYILWLFFVILIVTLLKESIGLKGTFIGKHIFGFMVGMASFYIIERYQNQSGCIKSYPFAVAVISVLSLLVLGVVFGFTAYTIFILVIPYFVWGLFLYVAFAMQLSSMSVLFKWFFDNKLTFFVGEISYSLYLLHMLAIYVVLSITSDIRADSNVGLYFSVTLLLSYILAISSASISYRYIEQPFMNWSRKASKRLNRNSLLKLRADDQR